LFFKNILIELVVSNTYKITMKLNTYCGAKHIYTNGLFV